MKNKVVLVLAAAVTVLVVSFAGCGKKEEVKEPSTVSTATVDSSADRNDSSVDSAESSVESQEDKGMERKKDNTEAENDKKPDKKDTKDKDNEVPSPLAFRNARWGESVEEVRSKETAKEVSSSDTFLLYNADVCDKDMRVMYVFGDQGLYTAIYDYSEEMPAKEWIDYYLNVKEYLSERYGEPSQDLIIALDEDGDTSGSAKSLKKGKCEYNTAWFTDVATVYAQMMTDSDGKLFLSVVAVDPSSKAAEEGFVAIEGEEVKSDSESVAEETDPKEKNEKMDEDPKPLEGYTVDDSITPPIEP